MKYLIDTNIICESTKSKPHAGVVTFLRETSPDDLFISVLSIGEIRKGIEKLKEKDHKKHKLQAWLEKELVNYFAGRIIPITLEVAEKWGFLLGSSRDPLPAVDSLIAASAIRHNFVLVTRNIGDFKKFPVEVLNPYTTVTSNQI